SSSRVLPTAQLRVLQLPARGRAHLAGLAVGPALGRLEAEAVVCRLPGGDRRGPPRCRGLQHPGELTRGSGADADIDRQARRPKRTWTAVAATAVVAVACAGARGAGVARSVDYGVRLAGPIDAHGTPLHGTVPTGRSFSVRVDLFTDRAGAASVTYDLDLPTGVSVRAPVRLETGRVTTGWRSH